MTPSAERVPDARSIRIETLAEGVYAAIAVPGEGAVGNAGIVDLGERTLVFDTLRTPLAAQELRGAAERLTGKPVTWVTISHWHDDHCAGNQVFVPGATIIGSSRTRELMATRLTADYEQDKQDLPTYLQSLADRLERETNERARQQLTIVLAETQRYAAAIPAIQVTLPDQTFERRLVLHGSHRTAELITYGGGHTESDAILYLGAERIAFAGDLAFLGYHPWLPDGDPQEWLRVLSEIERLPLRTVVPGHGPVSDPRCLVLTRDYIAMAQQLAEEALNANYSEEQLAETQAPPPYDTWEISHFFQQNLRFLYARAKQARGV